MSQFFQGVTAGSLPPSVPTSFIGNTGTGSTPVANIERVIGVGNISVDATGDTLTISDSSPTGLVWVDEATSFAVLSNHGYFVSATAIATLPALPSQGDEVEFVITNNSVTLTVTANTGQFICVGTDKSAAAGTTVGAKLGNSISLTYQASSTTWFAVTAPQGTWTTT